MIRAALIIATCCVIQLSALAQSKWHAGFRAGASISYNNLSIDIPQENIVSRYDVGGLLLSIPFEYQYSEMFSIVSGVTYLQKGTSIEVREPNPNATFQNTFVIDYLQLPVHGKLALQLDRFQIYLSAGFALAYATDLKRITSFGIETAKTTKLDFQASEIRRFDLGLEGGGGIQAEITQGKRLFVEMLYNAGVLDIDRQADQEVYNQGYTLTLGIMMPLAKKFSKSLPTGDK